MRDSDKFHAFRELERGGWSQDGKGQVYDQALGGATEQAAEPLLKAVEAKAGQSILDVACGPGYVAHAAADAGLNVTGLDFSPSMLAVASERVPGATFREGDAENLPFPDDQFDAVTCAFGLLHFGDAGRAVTEGRRVLRIGGRYGFAVWEAPAPGTFMAIVGGAIRAHGDPERGAPPGPDFFGYADPERAADLMGTGGLTDVRRVPVAVTIVVRPEDIVDMVYGASVRTAAILNAQEPAARAAIHAEITAHAQAGAVDGVAIIPMPAVIFSGRKD